MCVRWDVPTSVVSVVAVFAFAFGAAVNAGVGFDDLTWCDGLHYPD